MYVCLTVVSPNLYPFLFILRRFELLSAAYRDVCLYLLSNLTAQSSVLATTIENGRPQTRASNNVLEPGQLNDIGLTCKYIYIYHQFGRGYKYYCLCVVHGSIVVIVVVGCLLITNGIA